MPPHLQCAIAQPAPSPPATRRPALGRASLCPTSRVPVSSLPLNVCVRRLAPRYSLLNQPPQLQQGVLLPVPHHRSRPVFETSLCTPDCLIQSSRFFCSVCVHVLAVPRGGRFSLTGLLLQRAQSRLHQQGTPRGDNGSRPLNTLPRQVKTQTPFHI
jgi:hypothetical protein